MLKDKSKVLETVIMEERLLRKHGGERVCESPVGRKVRSLVRGKDKF
jgi:hypothetical protein